MLYYLVRPIARYVLRYYYRHIDLTGLENIPRDAPVILAANHPTAFIEPCLLACFQARTLHFLARGDLYKNPLATSVLRALHILPVYRIQDGGYDKLVRNYATFSECHDALASNRAIMILAEGRCIHERRLRPLRKGTARIALGAMERYNTLHEVYVVPVGVNFSAADRWRSTVMIRCGKPIRASEYLPAYRDQPATGIRDLTERLRADLSPLVVQVPSEQEAATADLLLDIARNDGGTPPAEITHTGAELDRELVAIETLPDREGRLLRYAAQLRRYGLRDRDVENKALPAFPYGALPAAVLLLPQLPLWVLAELIALTGPRTIEFYSPVRFAVVAVGTLLYLPSLLLLPWEYKIYLILSLITVNWSLRQVERLVNWRKAHHFNQLDPAVRRELMELRAVERL